MSVKGKLVGILVQKFNKLVKLKIENTEGQSRKTGSIDKDKQSKNTTLEE